MTDIEIEVFYENWSKDKRYFVATTNCIKFAYEIIEKLTDGKFLIAHRWTQMNRPTKPIKTDIELFLALL